MIMMGIFETSKTKDKDGRSVSKEGHVASVYGWTLYDSICT